MSARILLFPHGRREPPEPPVDRAARIDTALRTYLAVEDALEPARHSTLIAMLVTASGEEREAIIRELAVRR